MRLLLFTFLAIVAGMGIQWGFDLLPRALADAMHAIGMDMAGLILLPMIATAAIAYAMRIWNWYVVFLAVSSPFISFGLGVLFDLFVLGVPML